MWIEKGKCGIHLRIIAKMLQPTDGILPHHYGVALQRAIWPRKGPRAVATGKVSLRDRNPWTRALTCTLPCDRIAPAGAKESTRLLLPTSSAPAGAEEVDGFKNINRDLHHGLRSPAATLPVATSLRPVGASLPPIRAGRSLPARRDSLAAARRGTQEPITQPRPSRPHLWLQERHAQPL